MYAIKYGFAVLLQGFFTYLEKFPFLLPIAWAQRGFIYPVESRKSKSSNNAADFVCIDRREWSF